MGGGLIRRGGGLSFDWVWGCDRREEVSPSVAYARRESVSGEREGEAEMGDAIDDRVRGRNHEIRARRRVGPAGGDGDGDGGGDVDEREETRRARGPGRMNLSLRLPNPSLPEKEKKTVIRNEIR